MFYEVTDAKEKEKYYFNYNCYYRGGRNFSIHYALHL